MGFLMEIPHNFRTESPISGRVNFKIYLNKCGLGGVVVKRRAHDPRVVGSKPALATFEESILGPGVDTNVPLSIKEYKWVPGL